MKSKKIMVSRTIDRYFDPEGDVSSIIKQLQDFQSNNPGKDLHVDKEYGYEDTTYFVVKSRELETDEEYNKRINTESEHRAKYLEHCRKTLREAGELK